jgi:excisionase family DNA binding protein
MDYLLITSYRCGLITLYYLLLLPNRHVWMRGLCMATDSAIEQWVSVEQIASHLNVRALTIYKWLERKKMPAHKVGRLWRFKISEVDAWVRKGGAAEPKSRE